MIKAASTPIFGKLAALADPTRSRMLRLLEQQPLSVGEVCAIMQLPQSTASRHLKVLLDEGWAAARPEGASRLYRLGRLSEPARRIWDPVRHEVAASPAGLQDQQRLQSVLEARQSRSEQFFSAAAAEWESVRVQLFGARAEMVPMLAFLDRSLVVGDLGCGTGQIARLIAPFVKQVIGVDGSSAMLEAAQRSGTKPVNLELREGQLEALPLADAQLDVALLNLVLHYVVDPPRVLAETARVLKQGGRLLLVDMMPHEREDFRETMGHVWPGFAEGQLRGWLEQSGFSDIEYIPLAVDAKARGPALFVVRAV